MRAEARILVGLGMIGAGAAGLLAMNLWTLPAAIDVPCPEPPRCPPVTAAPALPAPSAPAPSAPSASAAPSASQAEPADAASDSSPPDGSESPEVQDAATSKSSDGTTFPEIRFPERSRAQSRELMDAVQPLAAYLRGHFNMRVVLVGHGDAGTSAPEYIQTGRMRAGAVLRTLVDFGVSASRITIEAPAVEAGRVVTRGVAPGTVQATVEPRFETTKGDADVP